jgi:hypothetical protein
MMANSVPAELKYSADNGKPIDYYFYDPEPGLELNPPGTDSRVMEIEDAWPRVDNFSLDREGFELKHFNGGFRDFEDEDAVKSKFYDQVVEFVKQHTGAKRVVVFDHTIRRRLPADLSQQTTVKRPAVMLVHSDYTPKSGEQRVKDLLPEEAEALLQNRVAFYNVWKSIGDPIEELPLAMCDAQTSSDEDMLLMELKYKERTGEIYVMRHAPQHKWYYFPNMQPDDALLLKTYDSETDGRARFMGHTAFEDPTSKPDAKQRQSVEVRTMAFF